jgi:hypothetical protein
MSIIQGAGITRTRTANQNRNILLLAILVTIIMTLGMASAYNSGGPASAMGHSVEELDLDVLQIDTSNNRVGIGTPSPDGELEIVNAGDVGVIIDSEGGSNDDSSLWFYENNVERSRIYWDGNGNDFYLSSSLGDIIIQPSGNVGIGTTTPFARLDVRGNIYLYNEADDGILVIRSGVNQKDSVIHFKEDSNINRWTIRSAESDAGKFKILSSNEADTRMVIDASGNVGIGTPTPSAGLKLDVEGRIGATEYCDENGANCQTINGTGGGLWTQIGSDIHYDNSVYVGEADSNIKIGVAGNRICVGNSSNVMRDGSEAVAIEVDRVDCAYGADMAFYTMEGPGADEGLLKERMRIDEYGNIGINTTNPSEALEVDGNILATGTVCDSVGCIGGGGPAGADSDWAAVGGGDPTLDGEVYHTGGVGIGTTNPDNSVKLHVDNGNMMLTSAAGSNAYIFLGQTPSTSRWRIAARTVSDNNFGIYNEFLTSYNFLIDYNTGNVGIGTTNPFTDFGSGSGDFTSVIKGLHVANLNANDYGALLVEGDNAANIYLADRQARRQHLSCGQAGSRQQQSNDAEDLQRRYQIRIPDRWPFVSER